MQTSRSATEVRFAVEEDAETVARILAVAFADDPVMQWMIPEPADRLEALLGLFRASTAAVGRHEEIRVARAGTGAALWLPPGARAVDESNAAAFKARMAEVRGIDGERAGAITEAMQAAHPSEPHWYLNLLGVVPAAQGRGIGSALLHQVLGRCDADGLGAYLEATTPRNRALYARHGFEVVGEIALAEGPSMWSMWREPGARR